MIIVDGNGGIVVVDMHLGHGVIIIRAMLWLYLLLRIREPLIGLAVHQQQYINYYITQTHLFQTKINIMPLMTQQDYRYRGILFVFYCLEESIPLVIQDGQSWPQTIDKWIELIVIMTSFVKNLVAGPKKKTPYNGQELDLTYITDRIIAMAYPASNFLEKVYRNSITDVANYFHQYHHNDFLIINVSSRPYDYSKFQGRVQEYEWPDHQAPPLTTLIDISTKAKTYLQKNKTGVIAVHCNHGKGRTGTAIISFMLFMSLFSKASEALAFYNSRRFSNEQYGVDQPCQTRYLNYIQNIIKMKYIPPKLIGYRLVNVIQNGLPNKYFINVKKTRTGKQLVEKFSIGHYKSQGNLLMGDLFIEVFEQSWTGSKRISRINLNTFFLNPNNHLNMKEIFVVFNSNEIKCSKSLEHAFTLKFQFQYFCLCHVEGSEGLQCVCNIERSIQQKYWWKMIDELQTVRNVKQKQIKSYFYFQSSGLEQCLKQQKEQIKNIVKVDKLVDNLQSIYYLSQSMSKLQVEECPLIGQLLINKQFELQKVKQFEEKNEINQQV